MERLSNFKNPLALYDAVNFAILSVKAHYAATFIPTEFGDVGIEVLDTKELKVCKWDHAPITRFWKNNRNISGVKWYVGIPRRVFADKTTERVRIMVLVKAFIKCIIWGVTGREPEDFDIESVVAWYMMYMYHDEHRDMATDAAAYVYPKELLETDSRKNARYEKTKNFIYELGESELCLSDLVSRLDDVYPRIEGFGKLERAFMAVAFKYLIMKPTENMTEIVERMHGAGSFTEQLTVLMTGISMIK